MENLQTNIHVETYYKDFLKVFSRFLKERGKYMFVMRYLFPLGRDIDFFKKNLYDEGAKRVLDTYDSLGPSYVKFGYDYYMREIFPIRNEWIMFCKGEYL